MAPVGELSDYLSGGIWCCIDAFAPASPLGATTRVSTIQPNLPTWAQVNGNDVMVGFGYVAAAGTVLDVDGDGDNVPVDKGGDNDFGIGSMAYTFKVQGLGNMSDDTLTLRFTLDNAQFTQPCGQIALFPQGLLAVDVDAVFFTYGAFDPLTIPTTVTVVWYAESTYKITMKSQPVFKANAKEQWFGTANDGREFTTFGTATATSTSCMDHALQLAKMEAYTAAKAAGQAIVGSYNAFGY